MLWIIGLIWLFIRFFATLISLITAAVTFVTGCVYFKLWKGYDVLIIGIHVVLCIAIPFFRHDSSLIAVGMYFNNICRKKMPSKAACQEIFKSDLFVGQSEDKKRRRHLISALSLSFFILRIRVSIALIMGRFHHAAMDFEEADLGKWILLFYKLLYIDIFLVFGQCGWAFFRQFQVCCQLGCVKYYVWIMGVFALGFLLMEIPMQYAFQEMDPSWCCWYEKNHTMRRYISCVHPLDDVES